MKVIEELYEVVLARKANPEEGSYTCYLFDKGLDKILKKVGEECAETIVAAKNKDNSELTLEICDLLYHLMVLMVEANLPLSEIEAELTKRREKIGNLKETHASDHNT
jgi:phosphoribosyl-ATP pyrophosphohydrolase